MENLKSTLLCKSRSEAHLVNDCNDPMRHYNVHGGLNCDGGGSECDGGGELT